MVFILKVCDVIASSYFTSISDAWKDNWIYSKHPGKEFGQFVLSSGSFYNDVEADKGLYLCLVY